MSIKDKMTKLEKIDYIIGKTIEAYPNTLPEDILEAVVFFNNFPSYITSIDNAREISKTITHEDVIGEIIKFVLRVAVSDIDYHIPEQKECIKFLNYLKVCRVNGEDLVRFLTANPRQLENLSRTFAKLRYGGLKEKDLKKIDSISNPNINDYLYYLQDNTKTLKKSKIRNIRMFNLNKCRDDILKGLQLQKGNVEYTLGKSMFAKSMIGNRKETQEDSVLLLEHPNNKNFKMLMIADGVGGSRNGGEASSYTARKILSWFERLNPKYSSNLDLLSLKLDKELKKINKTLNNKNDNRGTTFLCGIVGDDETLIASVGNSRAYITTDNNLRQISRDDSIVQEYYEKGYIKTKDDMRFHKKANYITKCLGMDEKLFQVNNSIIRNNSYDSLILVSDGVSDCLSDSQIMAITTKTPREKIAKLLVESADKNISRRNSKYGDIEYYETIQGGKDNETAAVYIKTK